MFLRSEKGLYLGKGEEEMCKVIEHNEVKGKAMF